MSCRPIRILAASAAAFLSVSAVHSQQPRISERRDFSASGRETLKLAKDATLEIKAVNADITVVKAQGEDATLNIERSAAAAEPRTSHRQVR